MMNHNDNGDANQVPVIIDRKLGKKSTFFYTYASYADGKFLDLQTVRMERKYNYNFVVDPSDVECLCDTLAGEKVKAKPEAQCNQYEKIGGVLYHHEGPLRMSYKPETGDSPYMKILKKACETRLGKDLSLGIYITSLDAISGSPSDTDEKPKANIEIKKKIDDTRTLIINLHLSTESNSFGLSINDLQRKLENDFELNKKTIFEEEEYCYLNYGCADKAEQGIQDLLYNQKKYEFDHKRSKLDKENEIQEQFKREKKQAKKSKKAKKQAAKVKQPSNSAALLALTLGSDSESDESETVDGVSP